MKTLFALFIFILIPGIMIAQQPVNSFAVNNSIIIIIHGDGDYLFHNRKGEAFYADKVALNKAVTLSEELDNSEIFIFHQKKKDYSFLFLPGDNLDSYFYKNGKLVEKTSSKRNTFDLSEECDFYKRLASPAARKLLLYYGHEIPIQGGYGYNSSDADRQFNMEIFSSGTKKFIPGSKFDLMVLSTCGNGSPAAVKELRNLTDYIIASPDDLHLSYMNPYYLKKLRYYKLYNFEDFVVDFAKTCFRELKQNVETATVISAFKTSELSQDFLNTFSNGESLPNDEYTIVENCDCAEINGYDSQKASGGVIALYNPPAFGKDKFKTEHSGWGCKKSTTYTISTVIEKVMHSK